MDRDVTQDQAEATPTVGREQLLQVLLRAGVGQVPYKKPPRVCQVFFLLMLAQRSALPGCRAALWGTTGSGGLFFPEYLDIASTCRKTGVRAVVGLRLLEPLKVPSASVLLLLRAFGLCLIMTAAYDFPGRGWAYWDFIHLNSAAKAPEELAGHPRPQESAAGFWGLPTSHVADLGWCHMTTQFGALME